MTSSTPSSSSSLLGASSSSRLTSNSRTPGTARSLRSSTLKRDSSTAMLDKESHPTSSKRALLTSTLSAASTERQLASLQTTNHSLNSKLREIEHELASVQRDRRFLADREKAEREAREESEKKWATERKKQADELRKLREMFVKMEEKVDQAEDRERKAKDEVGRVKREMDKKDSEMGHVRADLDDVRGQLQKNKDELDIVLREKEALEERDRETVIKQYVKEIEDRCNKEMEDERQSMEEVLEETVKEKDNEIADLKATIEEQQKEWEKMEEYAESLEKKLEEAKAESERVRLHGLSEAARVLGRQPSESAMEVDSTTPSSSQPVSTQPELSTPVKNGRTDTLSSMSMASPSSSSRLARLAINNRLSTPRRSPNNQTPSRRQSGLFSPGPSLSTPLRIEISKKDPDAEALGPHLASLTSHVRKLEGENVRMRAELGILRTKNDSVQVLKEEIASLQSRIKRQEQEIERLVKASAIPSSASSFSPNSPRTVQQTNELAKLRLEHANLLESFGEVKAELVGLKNAGAALPATTEQREDKVDGQSDVELKATRRQLVMKERELEGLQKELEFAKGMMDSYSTELQLTTPNAGLGSSSTPLNELNSQRVIQLETLLTQAKSENTSLRKDIETILLEKPSQQPPPASSSNTSDLERLQTQVTALESTIEEHLKTIDNLEQELFELRGEIAGGRHVPPNTRILKLSDVAPGDKVTRTQTNMTPTTNGDVVPMETYMASQREARDYKDELDRKEKRLLRLKEIYGTKTQEFREVVGALLGIKLAFYPNGSVRITSLYDMSATFVFEPSKDKSKMQLGGVGEDDGPPQDWRENLPNWQSYWIEQEQCIPGFLATVTLEVYDRWKNKQEQ